MGLLANLTTLYLAAIQPDPMPFVTKRGSQLYAGDSVLRFASVNVPNLFGIEDVPGQRGTFILPTAYEQKTAFEAVVGLGGQVIRSYTLDAGLHITARRTYNEDAFKAIDQALALAREYNVRIIFPLLNNGNDPNTFGTYAAFAQLSGKSPWEFFTNKDVIDDFKHLISFLLNRKNTVNGIVYKDDPTILCWQLGNEYGSWKDAVPPSNWILDIAGYIKSIDSNHLVMDGTLAGHDQNRWSTEALRSPNVDIFYNNYYWGMEDVSSGRIKQQTEYVHSFGKAFVICEYGLANMDVYRAVLRVAEETKMAGTLIWSLRFHTKEGGFYTHSEHTGHMSYHVPGFDYVQGFNDRDEKQVVDLLQTTGHSIQGKPVPLITPSPPEIWGVNGNQIKWRGSAWTRFYRLYRSSDQRIWRSVCKALMDGVDYGQAVYTDASKGTEKYYYKMTAVGSGGSSNFSNTIYM